MGLGKLFARSAQHDRSVSPGAFEVLIDSRVARWPMDYYRGGMGIPGAWRGANLIADLLGEFPWEAYRKRGGGPLQKLTTPPLLEQPSPPDTRMTTFSSLGLDLIWHGNAIGIYTARTPAGWPTAIVPVPATEVGVRRVDERDYPLPIGTIEYMIGRHSFAPWEVLHVKGPCKPGALRGFGVIEAHLQGEGVKPGGALDLAIEQQRQASNMANAGVPTGVLETSDPAAGEAELRTMKEGWLKAQRDRTVATLNASAKFTPLAWNPEQLQLVEARRYSLTDVENILGLPIGWLGGMNSARQYSNIEQDAVQLMKFTMGGHVTRFEQALSLAFPRGTLVRATLDEILRSDTLNRFQAHAIGLDKGFLTLDEVREIERREPLPEQPAPPIPPTPTEDEADDTEGETTDDEG